MNLYDFIEQLRQLPDDQRTKYANEFINHVEHFGQRIQYVMELLPTYEREKLIKNHFNKIENPVVFSMVLATIPEEHRLEFATQNYSFFSLEQRRSFEALGSILRLLSAQNRVDFALHYGEEIEGSSSRLLQCVLKELPQTSRFSFAERFSSTLFMHTEDIVEILRLLEEKDRLKFYLISNGTYLAFNELQCTLTLIPPSDIEQFLETNIQKMLLTFEISESICHIIAAGARHPIYYSLQRAFHAIESDQKDETQRARTYAKISEFFNSRYAINSKPYNPLSDNQYLYLRELEANAVGSLVQRTAPSFSSPTVDLITQYSGHYIDLQQSREYASKLESLSQDDLIWSDLVYLHKNNLVLRGVTDDDMAANEEKNGGRGDAISLANFGMGESNTISFSILANEIKMDEKYPQQKAKLLKALQEGMKEHIQNCLYFGYSVAFELVSRDEALCPYDFGETYRLGKCGSARFNASQVKKVFLRRDCPNWNIESIYRLIVADIKQLRTAQEQSQQNSPSAIEHQENPDSNQPTAEKMNKQPQQYNPKLFSSSSTLSPTESIAETKISWASPGVIL